TAPLRCVAGLGLAGTPACSVHHTADPSLALGSNDVSPLEMASAFAVRADHGIYHEQKFVSKVTNGDGQVLESGPSREQHVLDPTVVTTVNRILSEVMTMGTGTGAQIGRPAAGKTGPAEDYKNACFVRYTPRPPTSL